MATAGKMDGRTIEIHFGGTELAHAMVHSSSRQTATIDVTTKDSNGDEEVLPGRRSMEIQCSGLFAEDAGYGYEDLEALWAAGTSVTILETSTVSGDVTYSYTAYVTSLNRTAEDNSAASFECTLKPTGARTKGAVV